MGVYLFAMFFPFFTRLFLSPNRNKLAKKRLIFISLFPIFCLLAFKSIDIGADSVGYSNYFLIAQQSSLNELFQERMENGYQIFVKIIALVFDDHQWQFIIIGIFLIISLGSFVYRHSKEPTFSILFYYTLGLFTFNLSGLRQSIAMAICLFAYKYICERKLIKFLFVIIFAVAFHKSALFFLPAYFIASRKVNIKNIFLNLVALSFIFLGGEQLMLGTAELLNLNYGMEETDSGLVFLFVILIITVLSLIYKNNLLELNPNNLVFINLNFINLGFWCLRLISRTAERPSYYYLFASIILLEQILVSIKDRETRIIFTVLAITLSSALFIYRLMSNYTIYPFSFFWS